MAMTRLVNCHSRLIVVIALREEFHSELFATRSVRAEACPGASGRNGYVR